MKDRHITSPLNQPPHSQFQVGHLEHSDLDDYAPAIAAFHRSRGPIGNASSSITEITNNLHLSYWIHDNLLYGGAGITVAERLPLRLSGVGAAGRISLDAVMYHNVPGEVDLVEIGVRDPGAQAELAAYLHSIIDPDLIARSGLAALRRMPRLRDLDSPRQEAVIS